MVFDRDQWLERLHDRLSGMNREYLAMYSSLTGGVTKDPALMLVPVDDHIVHRGDGVFEAMRIVRGAVYDLDAHLRRLEFSAEKLSLTLPFSLAKIRDRILETADAAGRDEALVRLFVSRGPGGFTPNPYETAGSQLYIVITGFKPYRASAYEAGVRVMRSRIKIKPAEWAIVKSCNYLPNVLMKKESVDAGYDFAIGVTDEGFVAEGPTENIFIVSQDNRLLVPRFQYTLRGVTLTRIMELAVNLQPQEADIPWTDLLKAKGVFMAGTTLEVLPVATVDDSNIPVDQVLSLNLRRLLQEDMHSNPDRRCGIFPS